MSTPYEKLIRPVSQPSRERPRVPPPAQSATAAKKMLRRPARIEKPNLAFSVRPRFRFDVPPPPMDPKMLLGTLSTASYAEPHFSDLERNFRPSAIPSNPTHGLRVNLVDTQLYKEPARLTGDDISLLETIMKGRSGGGLLNPRTGAPDNMRNPGMPPPPRKPETTTAPWMRRMAYDEYDRTAHKNVHAVDLAAKMQEMNRQKEAKFEKSRRERLMKSFKGPSRNMRHPGRKMGNIRAVSAAPIYPDFLHMLQEFVSVEVDKDEVLTVPQRLKNNPEGAEESLRTTATVSVAERSRSRGAQKFVACYTPTLKTLEKRKRKQDETEADAGPSKKKVCFGEKEDYQWIGEYSIREGKFEDPRVSGIQGRSCFAISEHAVSGGTARVVTAARVGTIWKLSRRPQTNGVKLGKNGLRISLQPELDETNDGHIESILSGSSVKRRAKGDSKSIR
ncbi:RNA polymerase II associated factor Paf1 [Gracilaria domingensis]|nr:RNA polymerase II associated factor Paf1 [Gracilaria domingensis]